MSENHSGWFLLDFGPKHAGSGVSENHSPPILHVYPCNAAKAARDSAWSPEELEGDGVRDACSETLAGAVMIGST